MFKRVLKLLGVIVLLGQLFIVCPLEGYYLVNNQATLSYSNITGFTHAETASNTVCLVVLYGPDMRLEKFAKNEVTGESSTNLVPVNKGDTITISLYAANNQPNAETAAWHVYIYDTFTNLVGIVGQSATVGDQNDSFTYAMGSETVAYDINPESATIPDSIAYFDGTSWTAFMPYSTKSDTTGNGKPVKGMAWYWRYVPSQMYYVYPSGMEYTGDKYRIQVKFSIKRNNN